MDARTQIEYDRIAAGPHSGEFSFLHHKGPVVEHSYNVMKRLDNILSGCPDKPVHQQYDRLRHIYYIDPAKLPKDCQEAATKRHEAYVKYLEADTECQEAATKRHQEVYADYLKADAKLQEAYAKRRETNIQWWDATDKYREKITPYVLALVPNCAWDGQTIFWNLGKTMRNFFSSDLSLCALIICCGWVVGAVIISWWIGG